jgi:hypothetical protein
MSDQPPESPFSIVVPSCDAYSDTWPYFFHFLFRYWPDAPTPVRLVSNHLEYADNRVESIRVGDDRQWGDNLRAALPHLPTGAWMVMLDDFFLNREVDSSAVLEAVSRFQTLGGRYLGIDRFRKEGTPVDNCDWHAVLQEKPCVGLNAVILDSAHAAKVVSEPGMNIWQTESRLKTLAAEDPSGHFYVGPDGKALITYQEAIKGLFWKPSTLEFFKEQNVPSPSSPRPCPPQGQDFLSKWIRSWHKRRYRKWLNRRADEIAAKSGGIIEPLTPNSHVR